MDKATIVGMIAAICTTVSFVPQVLKVHKTRHTQDLSLVMYLIFSSGVFMWLCYGIMVKSVPIIAANGITFVLCIYIVAMKLRFK